MLAGYYTISSGLLTRQRELDVIGNNLINVQTPGYRADRLVISSFEQELLTRMESGGNQVLGTGKAATSSIVGEVVPLFHGGMLETTERDMDIAINGDGFYNIQGADGSIYLTRNGQFDVDGGGYLALPPFGRVMGQGGAISVGDENFSVDGDGSVFTSDGRLAGRILVTAPPNGSPLIKQTDGLFRFPNGVQGQTAQNYTLVQGSLERSNVDMNSEMVNMMEAQRAFQACSSALQMVDSLNRKAASQLASV